MSAVNRAPHIVFDGFNDEHLIVLTLDATEAEGIAFALGYNDAGGRELEKLAKRVRTLDEDGWED